MHEHEDKGLRMLQHMLMLATWHVVQIPMQHDACKNSLYCVLLMHFFGLLQTNEMHGPTDCSYCLMLALAHSAWLWHDLCMHYALC